MIKRQDVDGFVLFIDIFILCSFCAHDLESQPPVAFLPYYNQQVTRYQLVAVVQIHPPQPTQS